ncbi:cupin domain-containing protein [Streptomyces sp. HPF1205]|uniref:cupin domain-containing protein n=1 Tax=Streptomyces sp. HPF1205 TaxID=2873262 RepID=UPI001CEC7748|nr:cupin domain-containing protein [Streptomyces sp. HPF1205]
MSTSRAPHGAAPSEPATGDVRTEHAGHEAAQPQPQPPADGAPISRVIVMDQALPRPLATRRVEIRRITIAPGHASGLHVHNGPVFGSIETGSAVYRIEGEPETLLGPGDVFYEPEGVRIARFDAGEDGVTFLGYFLLAEGVDAGLVFPED